MLTRRKFSKEFKREAVELVKSSSKPARDLGIGVNILSRWCREMEKEGGKAFRGQGIPRDEELATLKRELNQVKKERGFFKRSGGVLRERIEVRFRAIECCRDSYPIRLMCRCLNVSPSSYYGWRDRPLSKRAQENQRLLNRIKVLHAESDGVKGRGRIWEDLRYDGESCSKHRIARLMQRSGIQGILQRRRWKKKDSGRRPVGVENHLERDFKADEPNTKWVTDITYIRTAERWLYLCVVLDLHCGIVVGWSMSHQQEKQLVLQAVLMALWQRKDRQPVILHSDRGGQFISDEYQGFLSGHNLVCSMSTVGSCADNAAMEGFFGMLKRERVNRRQYRTRNEARADIFDYIECFHNPRRRRKLEEVKQNNLLLTQLFVKTG
ncbi:MAG: IS3 family transposase [Nitrospirae bacterium]|nr:IS3 family transposase [Nitrospirota bacterium]